MVDMLKGYKNFRLLWLKKVVNLYEDFLMMNNKHCINLDQNLTFLITNNYYNLYIDIYHNNLLLALAIGILRFLII